MIVTCCWTEQGHQRTKKHVACSENSHCKSNFWIWILNTNGPSHLTCDVKHVSGNAEYVESSSPSVSVPVVELYIAIWACLLVSGSFANIYIDSHYYFEAVHDQPTLLNLWVSYAFWFLNSELLSLIWCYYSVSSCCHYGSKKFILICLAMNFLILTTTSHSPKFFMQGIVYLSLFITSFYIFSVACSEIWLNQEELDLGEVLS